MKIKIYLEELLSYLKTLKTMMKYFNKKITDEIVWSVKKNILFVNIEEGILKPQSKLDLLAIRGILEVIKID
ncbi:hypothetical protein ACO3TA_04035 [Methanocaldococcus sp. 28A]